MGFPEVVRASIFRRPLRDFASHELIEHRHCERRVPVGRAVDHAFPYQPSVDGVGRLHFLTHGARDLP